MLDTAFGTEGTILLPENPIVYNVSILKNDKILVSGTTLTSTADAEGTDTILLRYNGNSTAVVEGPITCFSLIDGKSNTPILILEDGVSYPITNIALNSFNIEASIAASQDFKSYKLNLEGPLTISRTENVAPYAVFGDLSGDFFGKTLPEGSYTMEAIPFVGTNATGETGIPLKISFEVVNAFAMVESFTLVESATGNAVARIEEGMELEIDEDLSYSIIANTSSETVGSVVMELSGPLLNVSRTENQLPYTIFGDINETIFGNRFSRGDYTISGTPYTGGYATKIAGKKNTINFSISFFRKSEVIPNPIQGEIVEVYCGERIPFRSSVSYSVYNSVGLKITEGSFEKEFFFEPYRIDLTGKLTGRGVYIIQFGPDTIQFVY